MGMGNPRQEEVVQVLVEVSRQDKGLSRASKDWSVSRNRRRVWRSMKRKYGKGAWNQNPNDLTSKLQAT